MKRWECPVMEELNIEMTAGGEESKFAESKPGNATGNNKKHYTPSIAK